MKSATEIETDDEILHQLALKQLDQWQAALAVRLIRGESGLLPLKFYPVRLQNFVREHSTD
jgi:hypothetical protein